MPSLKNISPGPRFVYSEGSPNLIPAGEVRDLALRDHEIANVQQQVDAGVLAWDGEAPRPKADAGGGDGGNGEGGDLTAAELLAQVDSMPFPSFRSAATKILGDGAPTTKAELIAALQSKVAA